MYDTYTRYLYEYFSNSNLLANIEQLLSNSNQILVYLSKILQVGVFGLGLWFVFKLLQKGWTRL